MQSEEETSSSKMIYPWSLFLYGMKAPRTRKKYRRMLANNMGFCMKSELTEQHKSKTSITVLRLVLKAQVNISAGLLECAYFVNSNVIL
jgi:hypothetical protein